MIYLIGHTGMIGNSIYYRLKNSLLSFQTLTKNQFYFGYENKINIKNYDKNKPNVFIFACGPRDEDLKVNFNTNQYLKNLTFQLEMIKNSKIIYISTAHLFSNLDNINTETASVNPMSKYGKLHFEIEEIFKQYKNFCIIRVQAVFNFNLLSKNRRINVVTNDFPRSLINNKKIILKTTGFQERNFISSKNISEFVLECIKKNNLGVFHIIGNTTDNIKNFKFKLETIFNLFQKMKSNSNNLLTKDAVINLAKNYDLSNNYKNNKSSFCSVKTNVMQDGIYEKFADFLFDFYLKK